MTEITRGTVWFRTEPPRRLGGLTLRGQAIRFGVLLPPASGPARRMALEAEGRALLGQAWLGYGQVIREVLVATGPTIPPPASLDRPWMPDVGRALVASRQAAWRRTRRRLAGVANVPSFAGVVPTVSRHAHVDMGTLEQRARAAPREAIAAFDHLEDTDLAAEAHALAHTVGELVAGLFGCHAEHDGNRWFDVCPLSLMHLRLGMSPGFVARRHCSLCDGDLSECEHIPGERYATIADRNQDGTCTICGATGCTAHTPGTEHVGVVHAVVREADRLDEISVVARPRDPLARLHAIEIPARTVTDLPDRDRANGILHCLRCVGPCVGFTSAEEALGVPYRQPIGNAG